PALLFYSPADARALHSFPTRRSSDLARRADPPHQRHDPGAQDESEDSDDHHRAAPRLSRRHAAETNPSGMSSWFPSRRVREQESDRKSTRLNSSHVKISYAVFCLKKK